MVVSIVRENTKKHLGLPNPGTLDVAQKQPNYFEGGKSVVMLRAILPPSWLAKAKLVPI
jgi:hypothetical protein